MSRQQGLTGLHCLPYWWCVERADGKWVVVDTSAKPVPLQVFGPTTKAKAEHWARQESLLYLALKGSLVFPGDWPHDD